MSDGGLFVVAYPEVSAKDRDWIETTRRAHDPNAHRIAAHFTLVFDVTGVPVEHVRDHLRSIAKRESAIPFICRKVTLGHDHQSAVCYAFLVPDEGRPKIDLLRTRLHTGLLAHQLRPEIPFIPHITLGSGVDEVAIDTQCKALSEQMHPVEGVLDKLTLIEVTAEALVEIETFPLLSQVE